MHDRVAIDSICFLGSGLQQQAEYWRELEPARVSLLGHDIATEGVAAAQAALATGPYRLETVVHPFLPGRALDPDRGTWQEPRDALLRQIDAASQLGAQSIYMVTGGHGGMEWERAAETFVAMVEPCAREARAAGVALMIENAPVIYADIHIAHSLRDTLALAELADIGVCIDLPGCWTEAGLQQTIARAMPRCGLVQVSDYVCGDRSFPCRAVPGDGDMPLERLFRWLLDAGYGGAFDLELLGPRIDQEGALAATRRAAERVSELLEALGA